MDSVGEEKKVCVTGANGYIASWIIKLLLERDYKVNATIRSLSDPTKTEHLMALDGAKERLHLFEADLSKEGSFEAAIQGCTGVFHTASPVKIQAADPQAEIIDPAVKGTLNVLASCAKFQTVKRVIFTSSMATVQFNDRPLTPEVVIDETWQSSLDSCNDSPMKWYLISKILAEEAAWKFVKEKDIDMVTINPGVCIGPLLQPTVNGSASYIFALANGAEFYLNETFGWVHVKDVAEAHILAFENSSAQGRYLLNESVAHMSEVIKILSELYPSLKVPTKPSDDKPFHPLYQVSKEKIESLGLSYNPLKVALKETIDCFIEKKLLSV